VSGRRALVMAAGISALLLVPEIAETRPGSGQGYSGRPSGSSGGSSWSGGSRSSSRGIPPPISSGAGSPAGLHPVLAIGMVLVFLAVGFLMLKGVREESWTTGAVRRGKGSRAQDLALLRGRDPEFSFALFEDFVRALYVRAQTARHDPVALDRLAPYLSDPAREALRGPRVDTVIVGSVSVGRFELDEATIRFRGRVDMVANLVVDGTTRHVEETWTFERAANVRTKPWEGVRAFGCPSCGAPLEGVEQDRCASCGQQIRPGRFDWVVASVERGAEVETGTSLTGTVEERGTDLPTVVDPRLGEEKAALLADDPDALTGFEARVQLVFTELNAAWAAQDMLRARPYLSASLFETLQAQLRPYLQDGLVNRVEGARIVRTEPARLVRDQRETALTIRLFGTGRDVTLRKDTRELVGGSLTEDRPYSEYWTFVRSRQARGAPRTDKSCPQCAAPLQVGMQGNCEHCGALVASGDFDWVLAGIDQDDAYRG
jgi:predicted lipid-binding transport protein (Tim44 family)